MENLDKYTKIELQTMGNVVKAKHDKLKEELISDTYEMERLEKEMNEKIELMQKLENEYVQIVEKIVE